MHRPRHAVSLCVAASIAAATAATEETARAEPSARDKVRATTLFNEARVMLAEGNVSPACRKLEESRRLDPQPGTILNLAACHEREGLTASAWAEFREARVLAARDGREDRVAAADEHLRALEPRLSWLVIVVGTDVDASTLHVSRDGTEVVRAAWGVRIPVDPGEHVVEAQAVGKKPWRAVFAVKGEGITEEVAIGPLENDEAPAAVTSERLPPASSPPPEHAPMAGGLSTRRSIALVTSGAGLVAAAAGTYFGLRAIAKHDDPNTRCTTNPCSATAVSLNDQAKFAADASTISFALAVVGIGIGAYLWFGDSPSPRAARSVTLAPFWTPAGPGVGTHGTF